MQLCKALEMEKRMHGKIRVVSIRQQPTDRDGSMEGNMPASVPSCRGLVAATGSDFYYVFF